MPDIVDEILDRAITFNGLEKDFFTSSQVREKKELESKSNKQRGGKMKLHFDEKMQAWVCGMCFIGQHKKCRNKRNICQCKEIHPLWEKTN